MHHHHHHHDDADRHPTTVVTAGMRDAALAFLKGLTASQQQAAIFPFGDVERGDWHYAPRARRGVALRDLAPADRRPAHALLEAALSPQGVTKALAIMGLEAILHEIEQRQDRYRDPLNYAFTIFGDPNHYPWGWRVEGHHLIINATIASPDRFTILPTFWGTNPAQIRHGPRHGERVMHEEYHLGLDLARSLSVDQRANAVLSTTTPGNILTERGRARALLHPTGLAFDQLDDGQRDLLMRIVRTYTGNATDAYAVPYLARVRESLSELRLAWAGNMIENEAFYYRIHGPRILIELDCTQGNANHIHTIWRDPVSDWGRDILAEHYQHHHDHD